MATDNEQLPSEFDVIVIGTGLSESIVSAAAARVGHTVLHIDPRDYYGGKWGTLCWESWTSGNFAKTPPRLDKTLLREHHIEWNNDVYDLEQVWYLDKYDDDPEPLQEKISSLSRKFNIDIFPKVLMAREEIIQILIHSNVSRYLEFKCITKLFSSLLPPNEHTIEPIPLSRSDIFTTKTISLIEKRSLMKFIESIMKMKGKQENGPDTSEGNMETEDTSALKTFEELSKECSLSKKVQHLLKSAVRTMDDCYFETDTVPDDESGKQARQLSGFNREFTIHCKRFLKSIGQYGNRTPFLWTLYGISEMCQAFCRMSAIYGGIFILKRGFDTVNTCDQDGYKVKITSEGKEIRSKYLVVGPEIKLREYWDEKSSSPKLRQGITLARAVLLTMGPRLQTTSQPTAVGDDDDPTNLSIHRLDDMDIIELDDTSLAVPKNYRMLQVTCPYRLSEHNSPRAMIESRLRPFLDFAYSPKPHQHEEEGPSPHPSAQTSEGQQPLQELTCGNQPGPSRFAPPAKTVVVYGSYFLLNFSDDVQTNDDTREHIFSTSVSSTEITEHVEKARAIFSQMYPNDEFLPKAPDPAEAHDENEIFPGEEDDRIGDDNDFGNVNEVQGPPVENVVHNGYAVANENPEEHMEEEQ